MALPLAPSVALRLLAACAGSHEPAELVRIRALATEIDDWSGLVLLADRHEVSALAHVALHAAGVAVPEPAAVALVRRTARVRKRSLKVIAEAAKSIGLLRSAGIPVLALKGPALAKLAYDDATVRRTGDLDLLVDAAALPAARAALLAQGYRQTYPEGVDLDDPARLERYLAHRKDVSLARPDGITVELHGRLANNLHLLDPAHLWTNTVDAEIAPGLTVATPTGDELILYLCLHGAASLWDSLKWLADVGALLARRSPAELGALVELAHRRGLDRPVGQALLMLDWLEMTTLPPVLRSRFAADRPTRWLFALAQRAMTAPRIRRGASTRYALPNMAMLLWRTGWRAKRTGAWALVADGGRVLVRGAGIR